MLCFLNERTISIMNAFFRLAGPSRPLTNTSDNLHITYLLTIAGKKKSYIEMQKLKLRYIRAKGP